MYATHTINAPGTLVAGYRAGDPIEPSVIEAWGLVEGDDYRTDAPRAETPAVPRPADDTDRGAWVAYALSRGADPDRLDTMDLAEIMDRYPEVDDEGSEADYPRPAESARKSEWVLYVTDHPHATAEDSAWAGDDSTTKADLMAWQPGDTAPASGDLVAENATEQANG